MSTIERFIEGRLAESKAEIGRLRAELAECRAERDRLADHLGPAFEHVCRLLEKPPAPAADREALGRIAWGEFERSGLRGRSTEIDWGKIDPDRRERWRRIADAVVAAVAPPAPAPDREDFQARVKTWLVACFGEDIASDRTERCHRFIEEALELVQSCGIARADCLRLIDYVYGRPAGETSQEVGGVMTTLAAFCLAFGLDMDRAAETELTRVWARIDRIREKQATKPKGSPLPEHVAAVVPPAPAADAHAPTLGGRVRHRATGRRGTVIARHDPDPRPLSFTVAYDDGGFGGPCAPGGLEPDAPQEPSP